MGKTLQNEVEVINIILETLSVIHLSVFNSRLECTILHSFCLREILLVKKYMRYTIKSIASATVKDTIEAIRKAQTIKTENVSKSPPELAPRTISVQRKSDSGKRKKVTIETNKQKVLRKNSLGSSIIIPISCTDQSYTDKGVTIEIERYVNIQLENRLAKYHAQIKAEILREVKEHSVIENQEALDAQCLNQISLAQEFLNENHSADLSRVKCLLRKMFPREYHDVIESLKEHQDPTIIYNICGGNNIIAPKAKTAQQLQNISEERKN